MAVRCPQCGGDNLELVQRLAGEARVLECVDCGNQWQRGEVPDAQPTGLSLDQKLKASFSSTHIPQHRLDVLDKLAASFDTTIPPEQISFRERYEKHFSKEGIRDLSADEFRKFYNSHAMLADVGQAAMAAEMTYREMGPEEFISNVRSSIEYLLYGERGTLANRFTDLVDGKRSPAVSGIKEAILTKVLVAALPNDVFPLLKYDSVSGKRQIAKAVFDINLPGRNSTHWTSGRLAIWSSDLFVETTRRWFEDLYVAAAFVWGLWDRTRKGDTTWLESS